MNNTYTQQVSQQAALVELTETEMQYILYVMRNQVTIHGDNTPNGVVAAQLMKKMDDRLRQDEAVQKEQPA